YEHKFPQNIAKAAMLRGAFGEEARCRPSLPRAYFSTLGKGRLSGASQRHESVTHTGNAPLVAIKTFRRRILLLKLRSSPEQEVVCVQG
ncbi:MAG TPA: hypothetical protein P5072_15705, partial [Parvularculaceae bacterium]|nr:hypothetical protein [Parvularculaceae bacterium]